jgi:perosamine synthetase
MIPVAKPTLDQREADAAARPILSGWVTQGPEVAAFEREFAAFTGAPHAVAVANCTVALHMALKAIGVGPGDEVITVSHSFIATATSTSSPGRSTSTRDVSMRPARLAPRRSWRCTNWVCHATCRPSWPSQSGWEFQ